MQRTFYHLCIGHQLRNMLDGLQDMIDGFSFLDYA